MCGVGTADVGTCRVPRGLIRYGFVNLGLGRIVFIRAQQDLI